MAGPDMDVVDLIKKIQDTYPTGLPVDGWYLLTVCVCCASTKR